MNLQKQFFMSQVTKPLSFRIQQLKALKQAIKNHEQEVLDALYQDLNKSTFEAYVSEIGLVYQEINYAIKKLPKWMKQKRIKTPIVHFPAKSIIMNEPYGVVLIIAPWNYPFQLALTPLVGAIAAGNTVVLKPSEYSVKTSEVIEKIISETFDEAYIHTIQGGKEETQALLKEEWDYIFFTGSVPVGQLVMEAAAKHLTPVTLELGGKSPCMVLKDFDVDLAAKRIVFGKLFNAGQTCVAPDYLLVEKGITEPLITAIKRVIEQFYPNILSNDQFPKIISRRHFDRLVSLIQGKETLYGGHWDVEHLKIEPTLLFNVDLEDPLMKEELFGPILPIIEFTSLQEAYKLILDRPKPLAFYLFTDDLAKQKEILAKLSFGGGCINDTIIHFSSHHLPVGGVGNSGMGSYHGDASFLTFSHQKGIIKRGHFDLALRYPPYSKEKVNLIKRIFK